MAVVLTDAAAEAVERVRRAAGDDLTFVIGNGCCDSTAPYLFAGHVRTTEAELGTVAGVPVLADRALAAQLAGEEVVIDATPDPAADSFSAEAELGLRFTLTRLPRFGGAG